MDWLVYAALVVVELLALIALIDALRRPSWQWQQADRSRGLWITLLVVSLFLPGSGFFVALGYFFLPQPALRRARRPIGAPGGSYRGR